MDIDKITIDELLDFDELKNLFHAFSSMTNLTIGLVDVVTNEVLLGVGWRDICTKFHRAYPESEKHCKQSNKKLISKAKHVGKIHMDHCENGLVDACTPIIVKDKHLANLFTGQFLLALPSLDRFRSQAQKYGYDEELYLKSLSKVPVLAEERISFFLQYMSKQITLLAENNLKILSSNTSLDKTKELLSNIASLAPIGIGATNNRTILWANHAMEKITGYSSEELIGLKGSIFYPKNEDYQRSEEEEDDQLREKSHASRNIRWKKKDGTLINVCVRSTFTEDRTCLRGDKIFTVLDTTKETEINRRLIQSEERFSLAVNAANLGLWDWNLITDEVFFSENYFTMLGYEADILPQTLETWKMLLHPEDLEKTLSTIQTSLSTTTPNWSVEFRMLSARGDYKWILGQGRVFEFTKDGMPLRATGIHQDITQRKQIEDSLKEKKRKYWELFDRMKSGVLICRAVKNGNDFIIEDLNSSILKSTQIKREKALGTKISETFSGAEAMGLLDILRRVSKGSNSEAIPLSQYRDDNLDIWLEGSVYKLPSTQIVIIINDISEKKRMADDLNKKQSQLEETNIALKVLIQRAEVEKNEAEEIVAANLLNLVEPHLNRLKQSGINEKQANHIHIIESSLNNLMSPFMRTSMLMNLKLSAAEVQVANLVKQGKTSKQIAALLGLSSQTIDKHRSHIRKKIGITNKEISLRELLSSQK